MADDSVAHPSDQDPLRGRVLQGRWRLIERIGEGGMGAVYLAEQLSIRGRRVAVKLLHPEFARTAEFVKRFRAEAERAAAVSDPRVVTVLDFGQAETGELFIAMEFVVGQTLADLMSNGGIPLARAVSFGAQLAEALHQVHEAGIVHRDVKPANVMIRQGSDDLKLMDFGVSRVLGDDGNLTRVSRAGFAVGTPAYMAPEQIAGGVITRQTDIYAWGVLMYALVAGKRPFEDPNAMVVQYKHVHERPAPLRAVRREVPAGLERIVMRALEKDPEARQRTMADVSAELRKVELMPDPVGAEATVPPIAGWAAAARIGANRPARRGSRRAFAVGGVTGLLALGTVAFFVARDQARPGALPSGPPEEDPALISPAVAAAPRIGNGDASGAAPARDVPAVNVAEVLALARFYLDEGDYDGAIAELSAAVAKAPDDVRLRSSLDGARKAKATEDSLSEGTE